MENCEAIEKLKLLIIENELPRKDRAFFGIKCPYCGKSDRIHRLEAPQALGPMLDSAQSRQYAALWKQLDSFQVGLAVCKFCLNPLALDAKAKKANPLDGM